MWPDQRMERYTPPRQEIQEDRAQAQSSSSSTQQRERDDYTDYSDEETETDDEAFHGSDSPVDLLLFTSIETYVLAVDSTEMASTSCIGSPSSYSHIMYYPAALPRSSTPERTREDEEESITLSDNDDVHALSDIPQLSDEENVSINSTLSTYSRSMPNRSASTVNTEFPSVQSQHTVRHRTFNIGHSAPIPEPSQPPRHLRSIPRMPPASNLATQVANRVIRYARCTRNKHEKDMCCLTCGFFPTCPVTGQCGHTRCTKCIEEHGVCPCGAYKPDQLYVNILIRDLLGRNWRGGQSSRFVTASTSSASQMSTSGVTSNDFPSSSFTNATVIPDNNLRAQSRSCVGPIRHKRRSVASSSPYSPASSSHPRIPMSPRIRFNHALDLLHSGKHREALPHLALVAASSHPDLQVARGILAQAITAVSRNRDPRCLTRHINRVVRHLSSTSWIKTSDLECILCCDTFTNPVTTPCGHMFCRTCLERTMDYKKRCPLCLRPLLDFSLNDTGNTVLVEAALKSINAVIVPPPPEPDLIPIFVCTVAYPSVPCPLFIFDPRYWLMIRRVLESGSRRFGMVACDRGQDYADYGTILEVRDCVHLEDGRSILSTIGLSRFKVIERGVRDGCEVARILPITDVTPVTRMEVWGLKMLATQIMFKALLWLNRLNQKVVADIEAAFGSLPAYSDSDQNWWETTDGPSWLWWLIAVLPLRSEIKILILSTDCLLKRMMAVSRTLEAVDQVTVQAAIPTECVVSRSVSSNNENSSSQPMEEES